MSSVFNFTVASWFLGNVRVKPISTHSAPPHDSGIWSPRFSDLPTALRLGTPVKQWGAKYLRIEFQGENSRKISYDIASVWAYQIFPVQNSSEWNMSSGKTK